MAQEQTFIEMGSVTLEKGKEYSKAFLSFATGANIVKLTRGNEQWQLVRDKNSEPAKDSGGNNIWGKTGTRGIRVIISYAGLTYPDDFQQAISLWELYDNRLLDDNVRITAMEDGGIVTYGKMVTA